ncbi:serine/threonine-protein kinase haspin homolog [Nilaparvata lugens]|uniref:serine/threonine-protein kinase haspin homolog n=1 Tax=Nilaparvata lugens TaxID=108931 RepID=UPI00193D2D8F|nr:serine/threonine-protein kinase haspin homolog [Nilaparvata lugens]
MRSRKRRSSFQQAVEISEIDEDVPNHSITSCQADLTKSYLKDPTLEETAILPADNVSINSISSFTTEKDDEQDIPLSELSQRLSNLEIDCPDERCVIQVHDSHIDKKCTSISSNKSRLHSNTSLVKSMRMSVACSSFSSQIDNKRDEIEEEDELKDEPPNTLNFSSSSDENISNCNRNIGEEKDESKIEKICRRVKELSSDESDKQTESEDHTVTSQDFLGFRTENVEAVYTDLKGVKEEDDHDDVEEDSEDDESKEYCYKDFAEKEFKGKINSTNVLDADSSLSMTGFELNNDRTFDFIPGKKYRRSLGAFRQSKSSTGLGSLSRVGCNRFSIIRPSAKLKASTRKTLITTTIEEDLDETLDVINVDEDKDAAKNKVLSLCDQTDILKFESVLYESTSTDMRKIGEGVYGEVFMMNDPRKKEESIVVKIIPVEGNLDYNGEVQKRFHEIISEIYISKALSNLKKENIHEARFWTDVYCNIIASNCFRGKYPKFLVDLWNEYDEKKESENDSPKMFPEDQLYISLKMSHGGEDIQNHEFTSARQSYYIILQVICALAVAERSLEFEHRDLHIGNILVSKTKEKSIFFKIDGMEFKLPTFNKKATIIDYTLSRINDDNQLLYNDLGKDEELFQGQGDLQFQIYRDMREDTRNEWNKFVPKTNLRWIHYLATKCLKDVSYKSGSDFHKKFLKKLSALADEVLIFSSCHDFMMNSEKTMNYRIV